MILLQLFTAAFAVACAFLNKWPVKLMRWYGMPSKRSEKQFHAANAVVKVLWAVSVCANVCQKQYVKNIYILLLFILILLLQWLFFDIALNLFTGKAWYYTGQTAWLDKLVRNGKVKAVVLVVIIILFNLFL